MTYNALVSKSYPKRLLATQLGNFCQERFQKFTQSVHTDGNANSVDAFYAYHHAASFVGHGTRTRASVQIREANYDGQPLSTDGSAQKPFWHYKTLELFKSSLMDHSQPLLSFQYS